MKLNLILIVISFCVSFLFGQNKQTIIQSGDYFYGSGTSLDVREARDQALGELTEQIAVRAAKSFECEIQEQESKY